MHADRGLGINDLGIKQVNLIKGPASVLYGSSALGRIILVKDDKSYLNTDELTGNVGSTYNSTSHGFRAYSSIGKKFNNDISLYYLGNVEIGDNFFQSAIRFDFRKITGDASAENFQSYGFILPGNP